MSIDWGYSGLHSRFVYYSSMPIPPISYAYFLLTSSPIHIRWSLYQPLLVNDLPGALYTYITKLPIIEFLSYISFLDIPSIYINLSKLPRVYKPRLSYFSIWALIFQISSSHSCLLLGFISPICRTPIDTPRSPWRTSSQATQILIAANAREQCPWGLCSWHLDAQELPVRERFPVPLECVFLQIPATFLD